MSSEKCTAITNRGSPCQKKPVKGSQRCGTHQLKPTIATQTIPLVTKSIPIVTKSIPIVTKSIPLSNKSIPLTQIPTTTVEATTTVEVIHNTTVEAIAITNQTISVKETTVETDCKSVKEQTAEICQPSIKNINSQVDEKPDPLSKGYHQIIDRIDYCPGHKIKDILFLSDEATKATDCPQLTKEQLDTQVFPGKTVNFKYAYIDSHGDDEEEALAGFWYTITTGTTLREVLVPLIIWGLSFETPNDVSMFLDGFNRVSEDAPWEPQWSLNRVIRSR